MGKRAILLCLLGTSLGCTRASEQPRPKAVAEPIVDGAEGGTADAGMTTMRVAPASAFSIVARLPLGSPARSGRSESLQEVAMAMPLVQRLPDGGLVIATEYARAHAAGPGALAVELHGRGFERDVQYRHGDVQGVQAIRWVWSDSALSIVSNEEATMRSGPRVASYKLGPKGFEISRTNVGYWSAVTRAGSVLALERTAYEVPNSGSYPKGSPYAQNEWQLRPARVAVLAGKGPAPMIPAGVCPLAMSAAPDGAVAIAVDKCKGDGTLGVLRYAPAATQATLEWFGTRANRGDERAEVVVFAASEKEIYAADGARLQRWDGEAWASMTPPSGKNVVSLSRGADGALWAVSSEGRLTKRAPGAQAWSDVPLPEAPGGALDEHPYAAPQLQDQSHFIRDAANEYERLGAPAGSALSAQFVDAADEEVLVLASVEREAFVLSTKTRSPVARLPSISTQRARIMQTLAPEMMTAKTKYCRETFLMFAAGTTAEAIRAKLGTPSADAGPTPKLGEAIVLGRSQVVVYGEEAEVVAAIRQLAELAPKRACSPAVIEKPL